MKAVRISNRFIGPGHPIYIIAEIGINHNGDLRTALKLIDVAVAAGCDAVKFQKRTPDICVPLGQREKHRDTPWGSMSYIDYRHRIEFGQNEYDIIDGYCRKIGITWFASCWDCEAVEFIAAFNPPCFKIASACLTDDSLLKCINAFGRPVILSTGMSTMKQIRHAAFLLGKDQLLIAHATSSYVGKPEELNLRMITSLKNEFKEIPIGYSGHDNAIATSVAAAALGACFIERHITLDRSHWGSDHHISLDPKGLEQMVTDIRTVEASLGDGVKRIYDSELAVLAKLRNCVGANG